MAITDKTRKILWGRSGSLCASCKRNLVIDETSSDPNSVVGDECHIISGAPNGPRFDPLYPQQSIDDLSNLLLLCRVHHKMIDDQPESYTAERVREIKLNHEQWVESKLREDSNVKPVKVVRLKDEIPKTLKLITSGTELFNLAANCHGSYQNHSDQLTDEEVELVGGFLQSLQDWVDLSSDLEPISRVRAGKDLDNDIKQLSESGFFVFAATERQRMEGGHSPPSFLTLLHINVVRAGDPGIIPVEP
jgi:hypothetical protein